MSEDAELDRLMAKRRAELERKARMLKEREAPPPDPRQALLSRLGHRGLEVLENAERQFPRQTAMVVQQLGTLISSGELREQLDGGKLLYIFRLVGLNVRMQTSIRVEQDGRMVSLSEKITGGGEQG